jgi:hypothetical protein
MHLRPPAIPQGVTSFLWAVFFAAFIWIGGAAVGVASATALIAGLVIGFFVFVFVRSQGEDEPRRPA